MSRRQRNLPRITRDNPERRKTDFDRRRHGHFYRLMYGLTLLPLGQLLNAVSGGRIPVRAGDN